jgi:predicted naringenin-chalcone synthase
MDLFDFHSIRPPYETSQQETFDWLVAAHRASDGTEIQERLWRVGCKPGSIAKRGHVTSDYLHRDWDRMEIFRLLENPAGLGLDVRMISYANEAARIFEEFYPTEENPPDDLIHVTCTGYVSPSGAQRLVSTRNWGQKTTVTHAYHMGCYGSIPALRMAHGFLLSQPPKKRADIVHTEICSIHANPSLHTSDQLVSQSLFADGYVKYSMGNDKEKSRLRFYSTYEEIIPHSIGAMSWNVINWGFAMSLSKEVPVLIARTLPGFLERLSRNGKWTAEELCKKAVFAVHPGGPKILTYVQEILALKASQMKHSFQILEQFGNMSSATLPHIWMAILEKATEPTPIVSLAFGPGLSICGAILETQCGG